MAAAVSEPALYRLLTFHVPNLMSLFRCLCCTTASAQVRGLFFVFFCNKIRFYDELLAPRPATYLEDHPLSAVRDSLFNIFAATLPIGGRSSLRNVRRRHAVVTGTHLPRPGVRLQNKLLLRNNCNHSVWTWIRVKWCSEGITDLWSWIFRTYPSQKLRFEAECSRWFTMHPFKAWSFKVRLQTPVTVLIFSCTNICAFSKLLCVVTSLPSPTLTLRDWVHYVGGDLRKGEKFMYTSIKCGRQLNHRTSWQHQLPKHCVNVCVQKFVYFNLFAGGGSVAVFHVRRYRSAIFRKIPWATAHPAPFLTRDHRTGYWLWIML